MVDQTVVINDSGGGILFVVIVVLMVLGLIGGSVLLGRGGVISSNLNVNAPGIVSAK